MLCFSSLTPILYMPATIFCCQREINVVDSCSMLQKKNQKNKSKLITWYVKTKSHFKQSYFLFKGNEPIKEALFYEKQHVELAAGFSCERTEEPNVDRCFKQLNSCCFFILEKMKTYWL